MTQLDPTTLLVDDNSGAPQKEATSTPPSRGRQSVLRKTFSTARAWIGAVTILVIVLWAIVGPLVSPWSATESDVLAFSRPPSPDHWFGTNDIGQDVYTQTLIGLQKSLIIGFIAGPAATLIAAFIGAIAGYFGGATDRILVWIIDLMLVLPAFYVLALLSPLFKTLSWVSLVFAIAFFAWMVLARVIRGQTMSLRERDYVKAARYMGVPALTIIRRHILPNVASLLIIDATLGVGASILTETTLSYFGVGVQTPDVSLGTLLNAGSAAAVTRPWLFVFPAGVLVITVLATSLLGDALRDAIDPTSGANRD